LVIYDLHEIGQFGPGSLFVTDLGAWLKDPMGALMVSLGKYQETCAYVFSFLMIGIPLLCWRNGRSKWGTLILLLLALALQVFYVAWLSRFGGDIILALPKR